MKEKYNVRLGCNGRIKFDSMTQRMVEDVEGNNMRAFENVMKIFKQCTVV
jgi:hypothetical protein